SAGVPVPAATLDTFQVLLPQTFAVTNTLDDGSAGSLRWALQQANALPGTADTISLTGVTGTISLLSALPTIGDSVTIAGPALSGGLPQLTVRRDPTAATNFRVLDISDGGASQISVGISNLTISGGNTGTGAGIQVNNELLTLN